MLNLFKSNKMFRRFLGYQVFSALGGGVFRIFMLLSVHLIYQNPVYTGIAGFLMAAPHVLSFVVGPIVDRGNKVAMLRITTWVEFIVLALLIVVPFQEHLGVWFMFLMVAAYSIAALFEAPAGTAYLPQIVEENEIVQANSLIDIVAMTGGIGISAALFIVLGLEDVNFNYVYGLSAVFVALAIIFTKTLKEPSKAGENKQVQNFKSYTKDLKEAARFMKSNILLLITFITVAIGFVLEAANVNRPAFAEYHVGPQGYVLMLFFALIGGVLASSFVGTLGKKFKIGKMAAVLFVLAGIGRIVFVYILPTNQTFAYVLLVLYGMVGSAVMLIFFNMRQKMPKKNMVGRVETMHTTFMAIAVALGALFGGFLGDIVPVVDDIMTGQGVFYIVLGLVVLALPSMRKLPPIDEIKRANGDDEDEAKGQ